MPIKTEKKGNGKGTNPITSATGVNGSTAPVSTHPVTPSTRPRLGRLAHGRSAVRITKRTSVWVASDSTNQPVWNSACVGVEDPQQHAERQEVEERADGPMTQHEAPDERDVPALRLAACSRRRRCRSGW